MTTEDTRVCFFGDSFTAGVGDPLYLGWVGRISQRSSREGLPLTTYNLGVRMNTSSDVLARFDSELAARRIEGADLRAVASFGVNDCTLQQDKPRVGSAESATNLSRLIERAARLALGLLVIGPPPVSDPDQNLRIDELSGRFDSICTVAGTPYVDVYPELVNSAVWMAEVRTGDGSHPGASGYAELAELVFPTWWSWLGK